MKIPPLKYLVPGTLAGLLLAYTGIGFLAVPAIVKSQAAKQASEKLHRQLTIENVSFNPFTLAASVQGLKMMEPDGATVFASFDRLGLDLSWQSVSHLAPVVQEVRLTKPYVHLARQADNRYNIDDILQLIASQPPSPEPARFSVNNIQLEQGSLSFEDKPAGVTHKVQDLKLGLPFVSSLPADVTIFVEPLFSANINGAPLSLKGKARPFAEPKDYALDLELEKVDMTTYLGYLPFKPGFKLPSAHLDARLKLAVVQPKDKLATIVLGGEASLTGVQLQQLDGTQVAKLDALKVKLGKLDLLAQRFEIAQVGIDGLDMDIKRSKDGKLNLAQLAPAAAPEATPAAPAAKPAATGPVVLVKELTVNGAGLRYADDTPQGNLRAELAQFGLSVQDIAFDGAKHTLDIASLVSRSADIDVHQGKQAAAPAAAAPAKPAGDEAMQIKIGKLDISDWSAKLREDLHNEPTVFKLSPLALTVEGYSNAPGASAEVALKTAINKGELEVKGQLAPSPLKADLALDLKNFDLLPLQPYVTDYVNLRLLQAAVTSKARLHLDTGKDGAVAGGFKGDVSVNRLSTVDKTSSNDFLSWKTLAFGGMDVNFKPFTLDIDRVALDDFFARVIIDPNGRLNVQDVMRKEGEEGKSLTEAGARAQAVKDAKARSKEVAQAVPSASAPAAAGTASAAKPAKPAEPLPPIRIGKVLLSGGRVRFTDNFIKPNYTANLKELGGTVSGLSSDPSHNAKVDLRGNVSGAPLLIAGQVHPLKQELSLDLRAEVRGMELSQLSAYADKYVGYGIEKGKMTFEVAYQLENRQLKAENRLVLDQLTFGKESTNPEATRLPVNLAVALLSDRNGVIDINVPIGGSLDDPQFSLGGIILKVISNAIMKTVTSPFALIGSMFGGGEELSMLEFDPGRAALLPASEGKLKSLAKALTERPGLKLDITGRFDETAELDALKRAALDRKLRQIKTRDLQARGGALPEGGVAVSKEEYAGLLARAYKDETFNKPRNALGFTKSLPTEEMEKLMLANIKFEQDDFISLGNRRAQAAKDWLTGQGQVPPERVFLIAPKPGAAGRVDFALH
jgi:uncharacterized protein involved in outer membrane biogenesis